MKMLQFVFLIFFYHEVFAESSKISRMPKNLDRRNTSAIASSGSSNSAADDLGSSPFTCEDLNVLARSLTMWISQTNADPVSSLESRFYYSTRNHRTRVRIPMDKRFTLRGTNFSPKRRTVMLVHGFASSIDVKWVRDMEEALHAWDDVNVIVVDWRAKMNKLNYYDAVTDTEVAGKQIASFLYKVLRASKAADSSKPVEMGALHLIGHSLGAHISGIAAHALKKLTKEWRIHRITGLDPANVCFRKIEMQYRLDAEDADYVDVIHTSSDTDTLTGFGLYEPLGDIDYYVNGGYVQPGCADTTWLNPFPKTDLEIGQCSHQRAHDHFIESLWSAVEDGCTFWGLQWNLNNDVLPSNATWLTCNSDFCSPMGIRSVDYPHRGTYYVYTGSKSPYCKRIVEETGRS